MTINTEELYLGIMSGTSLDSADVSLIDFSSTPELLELTSVDFPVSLRKQLLDLCSPGDNEIARMGSASRELALFYGDCVNQLLKQASIDKNRIIAIGSHGQTIRHHPKITHPFTCQIGDPATLTEATGITTIADFRSRDIAAGGEGAPLAPAFHNALWRDENKHRIILNIGGMANISCLFPNQPTRGFDTGPGNTLLDYWVNRHLNKPYDTEGTWAQSGKLVKPILTKLLTEPYFSRLAPKSTGRELFNMDWLNQLAPEITEYAPADIQRTLVELTAQSIADEINALTDTGEVFVCGGGAFNQFLMTRLEQLLPQPNYTVATTAALGLNPQSIEAMAFAWLARQTVNQLPGNEYQATGAKGPRVLGAIYPK